MCSTEFRESSIRDEAKDYAETLRGIRSAVDSGQPLSEEQKSRLVKLVRSYLEQDIRTGFPIGSDVLQETTKLVPDIAKQIQSGEGDLVDLAKKIDMEEQALGVARFERIPSSPDFGLVSPRDQKRIISWAAKDRKKFYQEFRGSFASEEEYQAYLREIRATLAELAPNKVPDWFLPGTDEYRERKGYLLLEPTERIIDTVEAAKSGLSAAIILLRNKLQNTLDLLTPSQDKGQDREVVNIEG